MSAQYRPTRMEVSGRTLGENVALIRRTLRGRARLMAVVKADAYGHGAVDTARVALNNGADFLAVAIVEEGVRLREAGIRAPILVLGGATGAAAREAVRQNLALALYDMGALEVMQREAARLDGVAHAHIKIDTGMSRVGLTGPAQLERMLEGLKRCRNVKAEGVFTHFAAADEDREFTMEQNARFLRAVERVRAAGFKPIAHASASAAMLVDPALWHDMVRPGIAIYGAAVREKLPGLAPAQRLATRPVRVETIRPGDTVSYGRTFEAKRPTRIMTLPIGYGDGYPRILGGKASVLVKGRRAPVVGRVCMDMLMADVTDIEGVGLDDEVVLMGEQGGDSVTADELARLAMTIPYEIMLGFHERIPRRFVQ